MEKEPVRWITARGHRIPIFEGQDEFDAIMEFREKHQNTEQYQKEEEEYKNGLKQNIETNKVINSVSNKDLGKTFNSLSTAQQSQIKGMTALVKTDMEKLVSKEIKSSSKAVTIGGVKYNCIIENKDGNLVYTLKQGNKYLVRQDTQEKVLNQLANIFKKG